jgi:hypothetical protein
MSIMFVAFVAVFALSSGSGYWLRRPYFDNDNDSAIGEVILLIIILRNSSLGERDRLGMSIVY